MHTDIEDDEGSISQINPTRPNSRVAVASVGLNKALGATGRRLIRRWTASAAIIKVPTDQWITPIRAAVSAINPRARFAEEAERPKAKLAEDTGAAVKLAMGGLLVGVSADPENRLPAVLRSVATQHYEVAPPSFAVVKQAMALCLLGKAPAALRQIDFSSFDFDLLCACMPAGGTKAGATALFSKVAPSIVSVPAMPAPTTTYPDLEDAVEYGTARTWGLELKADIEDLRSGKIAWSEVDRGAVLEGPPGSGKTTFARILGKACNLPVTSGSIAELFAQSDGHLDGVIKAQRELFSRAIAEAPAILFIDELNALPDPATISPRGKDWWLPVIYDFYLLLDSAMSSREGLVVIGATNLIGEISPALLRPGRLERSLHIGVPGSDGLTNILRTHLGKDLITQDLNPAVVSGLGATAAIAMDWVRNARRAARRAGRPLTMDDLLAQIAPTETRSEVERRRVAVHEAGHAVIGIMLGRRLKEVSVTRHGLSGGKTVFERQNETLFDREGMERDVIMTLAGAAAETEIFGSQSNGAGGNRDSDLAKATTLMATLRGSYGMRGPLLWMPPEEVGIALRRDARFREAVDDDLQRLFAKAVNMAGRFRAKIVMLADVLVSEERVSGTRAVELITAVNIEDAMADASHPLSGE